MTAVSPVGQRKAPVLSTTSDPSSPHFEVIDSELVKTIIQNILGVEASKRYCEDLRVHLLRLATLLI